MNRRRTGTKMETLAAEELESLGYRILERNFRCRGGEIDLIAMDDKVLVFVEVKYRSNENQGTPQEAVDIWKQQKICQVAQYYMVTHHIASDVVCRFDVVAITQEHMEVIKNAFWGN